MDPITKAKIHDHEEYRALERISSVIKEHCQKETAALLEEFNAQKNIDLILAEAVMTDISVMEILDVLYEELLILGLYKKVELSTKRILKIYFQNCNADNLYKKNELTKALAARGIKLTDISGSKSADELRALSNAIKHQGIATTALAEFKYWKKGQKLSDLLQAYQRLKPGIIQYLLSIDSKLKAASNK